MVDRAVPGLPTANSYDSVRRSRCSALLLAALPALAALAPVGPAAAQQAPATSAVATTTRPLVFRSATVIDVKDGRRILTQTVVVTGDRVRRVGPDGTVKVPAGARVIDARGKYLIPGLWDMHSHPMCFPGVFYPLLIANGVTGIREPGTQVHLDTVRRWRREIAAGTRLGPRVVVSGTSLDRRTGGEAVFCGGRPVVLQATTPAEARRLVDSLARAGADFIKVHNEAMPRPTYFAVAAEARRVGIPFGGHLPDSVTAIEASDSGQRAIDHFNVGPDLQARCTGDSATVRSCAPVAARFRKNGTWFVPTMVQASDGRRGFASESLYARLAARLPREFIRYWPDSVLRHFPPAMVEPASLARLDSEADSVAAVVRRSAFTPYRGALRVAHEAGLPVLAGTDAAPVFASIPAGFSLHAELAILAAEGLTTLEALQAATLNPAKFLGATDTLGTVAAGKVADLVLLDADPLADIANTAKIRAVVANGRYFDRAALDGLLADLERAARQ